jgi:NNP family nitrate/nitrite transporter-like MFS transporter
MGDTGWFCFLYSLTFGGFVGLSSYLSIFFHDQYQLTKVQSGDFTSCVILFGSFVRPVGGAIADRVGGYRLLVGLLAGAALCMAGVATLPAPGVALAILALGMGMLGMGNGSVFQLLPQRFPGSVGILTGVVGAAGGLGGFILPSVLGLLKDKTGTFGSGFAVLAGLALTGATVLLLLRGHWSGSWPRAAALRAGILPNKIKLPEGYVAAD